MGAKPSSPSVFEATKLRQSYPEAVEEAGEAVARADVFVLLTGAGFSADSGLAVYRDVASVKAYRKRGLEYHDLCDMRCMNSDPETFWGFWGGCANDYRVTNPHEGYDIIRRWKERQYSSGPVSSRIRDAVQEQGFLRRPYGDEKEPYHVDGLPGAFFLFTSNVDADSFDHFHAHEILECHGNTELYQCAFPCSMKLWRAPERFEFTVDTETMHGRLGDMGSTPDPQDLDILISDKENNAASHGPPSSIHIQGCSAHPHLNGSYRREGREGASADTGEAIYVKKATQCQTLEDGTPGPSHRLYRVSKGDSALIGRWVVETAVAPSERALRSTAASPLLHSLAWEQLLDGQWVAAKALQVTVSYAPLVPADTPTPTSAAVPLPQPHPPPVQPPSSASPASPASSPGENEEAGAAAGGLTPPPPNPLRTSGLDPAGDMKGPEVAEVAEGPEVAEMACMGCTGPSSTSTQPAPTAAVGQVQRAERTRMLKHMPPPVDPSPELAAAFPSLSFPKCIRCGGEARPAVMMFRDGEYVDLESQEHRWITWVQAVQSLAEQYAASDLGPLRVCMLEIGAGGNVTTTRMTTEGVAQQFALCGAEVTAIRVNPELPFADERSIRNEDKIKFVSIMSKGLDAIRDIDRHAQETWARSSEL